MCVCVQSYSIWERRVFRLACQVAEELSKASAELVSQAVLRVGATVAYIGLQVQHAQPVIHLTVLVRFDCEGWKYNNIKHATCRALPALFVRQGVRRVGGPRRKSRGRRSRAFLQAAPIRT